MIVEKHPINEEAIEEVYDFYELKDIELSDGSTGQVKQKVETCKKSDLLKRKENLQEQINSIDLKLQEIGKLE